MGARQRLPGLVAALTLLGSSVFAQTTGRIEGRVLGPDGQVLAGVAVTVASPSLQGTRSAVTEADGVFRFAALAPGSYAVKAELSGFNPLEVPEVLVALDRTSSLELSVATAQKETVIVTGEAPLINQTETTSGADFSRQIFQNIPTGRTFQSLAFATPGVVPGGIADSPSVYGASAAENRYIVDGLDITDPAFGVSSSTLAFEFIQEVQVKTGGYPVDYSGALGGVINVLTKSGGNEFHGDVFGYFNNDALQATARTSGEFGRTVGVTRYDFGADAGGKILEDTLWYFAAINPSISDVEQETRQQLLFTEQSKSLYYAGKLTWALAPQHRIVASAFGDPGTTDNAGTFTGLFPPFNSRNAAGLLVNDSKQGAYSYVLTYDTTPSANLVGELSIGRYDQRHEFIPVVNTANPYLDLTESGFFAVQQGCGDPALVADAGVSFAAPGCIGGTWVVEDGSRSRDQLRAATTYFWKNHGLKGGIEYRRVRYTDKARSAGPPSGGPLVDSTGAVVAPDGVPGGAFQLFEEGQCPNFVGVSSCYMLRVDDYDSGGDTDEVGLFLRDDWQITPYLTVNAGLRVDSLKATGEASESDPLRKFDFSLGDMIAPRVGAVWDPFRNGRSRVFAGFGRYYESFPAAVADYAFGAAGFHLYFFTYPEGDVLPTYSNLGTLALDFPILLGLAVDPNLDAQYTDEISFGFEHEVTPGFSVGIRGVDRRLHSVVEDISVDNTATYFVTNPGGTYTSNPVTGEPLAIPVTFPVAERKYQALEVTANKRFGQSWQLYGSYVYSRNEGNYGGLYRQDNQQLAPNLTTVFDLPDLLTDASGRLPNDRPHQVKVYGSYAWPFRLVTGLNAAYLSGTPISKLGSHPIYSVNERFVTPRGTAGRTDGVFQLDLHFAYGLPIGQLLRATLIADLFNATNSRTETVVDQTWTFAALDQTVDPNECGGPGTGPGTSCPQGNPSWGSPIQFQEPLRLRLGVRLSW